MFLGKRKRWQVIWWGWRNPGDSFCGSKLYPDPHGESQRLISIPLSRVDRRRPPSREEGNWMKMDLAPRSEYEGLSSSAN